MVKAVFIAMHEGMEDPDGVNDIGSRGEVEEMRRGIQTTGMWWAVIEATVGFLEEPQAS